MKPQEIRDIPAVTNFDDTKHADACFWLREIAYQIARVAEMMEQAKKERA